MGILDLVIQSQCVGCGVARARLCSSCMDRFRKAAFPHQVGAVGLAAWSGSQYDGVVRHVLLAAKRTGHRDFIELLADLHFNAVLAAIETVPDLPRIGLVPIHSGARTRRGAGLDIVLAMLKGSLQRVRTSKHPAMSHELKLVDALRFRQGDRSQKELNRSQRQRNVQGRFYVRQLSGLSLIPLLIVDDVFTTGATILSANRALADSGAQVVGAAVAADRARQFD